ncbi:hypothetical protein EJ08DRAFT_653952 [Tothia fuscella]|uniref:Uncharacterized protein n=1 Tax=Tothia fuscella TaxID=1048955 RepID=A0A9P4NGB6_9PEZI|nr:hypothetical protein EJ08DRAFT_653952 [Tothia fuscella]
MVSRSILISLPITVIAIILAKATKDLSRCMFKIGYHKITAYFDHPYQAYLDNCDGPAELIHGEYMVKLKPGHSLRSHSKAIGTDIEKHITSHRDHNTFFDMESIFYDAQGIGTELLMRIRADPGVYLIGCNTVENLDDFLSIEMESAGPVHSLRTADEDVGTLL